MSQDWKSYENAAEKGPLSLGIKIVLGIAVLCALIAVIGVPFGWFSSVTKVAKEQYGPEALVLKYEWFKNASAQLDKKQADINVYVSRQKSMEDGYKSITRDKWPREDREQYNTWSSEIAGVKASYNSLAAEYNSAMAKVNWRFANIGDVPQGGKVLSREYATYLNQ